MNATGDNTEIWSGRRCVSSAGFSTPTSLALAARIYRTLEYDFREVALSNVRFVRAAMIPAALGFLPIAANILLASTALFDVPRKCFRCPSSTEVMESAPEKLKPGAGTPVK
jgi:hypothetical protein